MYNALRSAPLSIAADLPSTDALCQCIRRQRPQFSLDINNQLPEILKQTNRGEQFLLFEDESMIIFTSQSNLIVLSQWKHWFLDGTFSVRMPLHDHLTHFFLFSRSVHQSFSNYSLFMGYIQVRLCH